jgi:enediyne biosynthesis protein E4
VQPFNLSGMLKLFLSVNTYKILVRLIFFIATFSLLVSCNKSKENSLFVSLPSSQTHIAFTNTLEKKKMLNILYYLYYYNGGGVAIGDINNDGLDDIYFTANSKGNNRLYLNKGNFEFEDITEKAGVAGLSDWCSGVTMADVNNDGLLDMYVSTVSGKYGLTGHNELYINNGNATFAEKSELYGLNTSCFTTQSVFFDYDRDGDLDCYILNQSHHPHANIVDTSKRRNYDSLSGDRLYRNDISITGRFTDVSKQAGIYQSNLGYGLGLAIGDFNNDGWDDIYIGNDFHENDYYYINNGPSAKIDGPGEVTFTESGAKHFEHYSRFSMGNDIADYNNDGQLDLVTVDMLPPAEKTLKTYGSDENPDTYKVKLDIRGYQKQYSKNCLQRNNGNGTNFSETSLISGVSATDWSWAPLFADFDNDGKKDLFISSGIVKRPVDLDYVRFVSDLKMKGMDQTDKFDDEAIKGMPDGSSHPFLFKNKDGLHFQDMSNIWGTGEMKGYFTGAAYADLDNDGNLDLVINQINNPAVILKNNAAKKKSISISFKSDSLNRFGIGAKAYLFQNGKQQYQQLMLTRGFQSSCPPKLHFGLDSTAAIDSILIVWPSQKYQLFKNVDANKPLTGLEKNAAGLFNYTSFFHPQENYFTTINAAVNWQHRENDFLDYNVQYLIPHLESTRGPKLAVADINGDGLDDFYACGAKLQPGTLMLQQKNGSFQKIDSALFNEDAICEDVDATFFDADGNGTPDLLVVSGGNEIPANSTALTDRLYLNDGRGHFKKAPLFLSQRYENKSCIATADVDEDGDIDIFIGNTGIAGAFGNLRPSYFFLNDGKKDSVHFSGAFDDVIKLSDLGIVTAASFADVNNDGWPDLVTVGEWMAVTIFINNKGRFTKTAIPASTGLWQTVYVTDVNGDGFTDILAGNWGHNTKLYAGKNGPLKLYIKDFDKNGTAEQIMCYTIDGKEYPFLAKDELERALPVLKKAYLTYSEVAGQTVQYMFYDLFKDYKELKAEVLGSSCFINDGKGSFKRMDLPEELQLSPIMAFTHGKEQGYIAAGNFYGVIPYEGRYDALLPTGFYFDKVKNSFVTSFNVSGANGEARDAKWMNYGDGKALVIARNNQSLVFLK